MAKAALNMIVRSLGPSLARQRLFLSAVDTGWVSRMRPIVGQLPEVQAHSAPPAPPLSALDAAARVLDPIAAALLGMPAPYGVLLRNYRPVPW